MIVTKDQAVDLIKALGDIKQHNYKNNSLIELLDKHLSQEQKEYLIDYVGKKPEEISESEFQEKSSELISHLGNIQSIDLSLSFDPTLTFLERIHSQISQTLKEEFLFDIALDKSIIGGVVMGYKGKIFKKTVKDEWN